MKLITLYKALLDLGGMSADRDGFVSGKLPGSTQDPAPVTIKGKRLVLPTQKQLTTSGWEDRIVFHPLYENVLRGESQVIEKLRTLITMRINVTLGVLCTGLLELAGSTDDHAKLNPDQSMFLAKVRMIDAKSLDNWKDLLKALEPADGKQNFIHVFLKRSGTVAGKKHARVGVVNFPVMKALCSDEKVFNFKPRNKDREVFKNLLEYVFKDIVDEDAYNAGSDSSIAPYTDAMLRTFLNLIAPINDVIDLFSDIRPELAELKFNSDWVEELDKLESYHVDIRSIPMQAGNEGTALVKGVAPTQEQQAAVVADVAPVAPVQETAPAPTIAPPPWVAPVATPNTGYQFPNTHFTPNTPTYPHMSPHMNGMAPNVSGPARSKDGVDFNSLLASNPNLAMVAHSMTVTPTAQHFGGGMMHQQQQQIPRWAQNPMGGMSGMGGMGLVNYSL